MTVRSMVAAWAMSLRIAVAAVAKSVAWAAAAKDEVQPVDCIAAWDAERVAVGIGVQTVDWDVVGTGK